MKTLGAAVNDAPMAVVVATAGVEEVVVVVVVAGVQTRATKMQRRAIAKPTTKRKYFGSQARDEL